MTYLQWKGVGVALQPVLYNSIFHLLVIRRAIEPFIGGYALPGGFAESEETLAEAATRELREETGVIHDTSVKTVTFWQAVGSPSPSGNDPRRPMLQFEVLPKIDMEQVRLGYRTAETERLALVRLSEEALVDQNGTSISLCFPLHQQAAIRFLKRYCPKRLGKSQALYCNCALTRLC